MNSPLDNQSVIPPRETLQASVEYVTERLSGEEEFILVDSFLTPNMDWEIIHHYAELKGKQSLTAGAGITIYHGQDRIFILP